MSSAMFSDMPLSIMQPKPGTEYLLKASRVALVLTLLPFVVHTPSLQ